MGLNLKTSCHVSDAQGLRWLCSAADQSPKDTVQVEETLQMDSDGGRPRSCTTKVGCGKPHAHGSTKVEHQEGQWQPSQWG